MVYEFIIYHLSFIIIGLPLTLFMFWFFADHTYDTFTADDGTLITDFFD
jgi:hypothetical protein